VTRGLPCPTPFVDRTVCADRVRIVSQILGVNSRQGVRRMDVVAQRACGVGRPTGYALGMAARRKTPTPSPKNPVGSINSADLYPLAILRLAPCRLHVSQPLDFMPFSSNLSIPL
jgi:hypothetical protein